MADKQSQGRQDNAASPGGKPDPATSDEAVRRTGLKSRKAAGPDEPDATVVGDTFKTAPGQSSDKAD
jgi:ribonucleotide monophosphatase NagD (HAD superfamily)